MTPEEIAPACQVITQQTGLPAFDILAHGADKLIDIIEKEIKKNREV